MNYLLTITVFQGAGQFSQLQFDIQASDDQAAVEGANGEMSNHRCLQGMSTLSRVDACGQETIIAKA